MARFGIDADLSVRLRWSAAAFRHHRFGSAWHAAGGRFGRRLVLARPDVLSNQDRRMVGALSDLDRFQHF